MELGYVDSTVDDFGDGTGELIINFGSIFGTKFDEKTEERELVLVWVVLLRDGVASAEYY